MNKNFFILSLFFLFAFWVQSKGQPKIDKIKFDHLTVNNDLSSNRVWCIFRDSKDYLWISTDVGLDKYDSYQVKKYRNDEKIPGSISNNRTLCIYEDRQKKLWFGSIDGLNLYDPLKDNFRVYKNNPADNNSLSSNHINSIIEDNKGNLWVVSDGNCLNKLISGTQMFIRYPYEKKMDDLYPRPSRMIAKDSKGFLWMVSVSRGIHKFDPESEKLTKYDDPSIDFGVNCYKSIFIDSNDKIWITTDGSGFFSYDPATNIFEKYGSKGDGKGTNQEIILDIIPESERYLLLAVDQGGINRFDKVTRRFEYFMYDRSNESGLNNNGIWCFHRDRENILWIGTSGGGINYYNPQKEKFKLFTHTNSNSLSYNFTGCFFEDHEDMIWIGTDGGGVNVYNPKTGNFKIFKNNPSDPYSISGNVIRSITEDNDGDMWIATWDAGLNRYDRKTGRFYRYMPDKNDPTAISGRSIWNIKIDHNENLWLGHYVNSTDLFNKKKGVIQRFTANPEIPGSISSTQSFLFYEDSEKNMWICTENGLDLYNDKTNTFKVFKFPDKELRALIRDKDGMLWVGSSSKGIFYCRPNGTILKTYNTSNGLPSNIIQAIVEDDHGNIWIATGNGISKFDRNTKKFRNYSKEDGLQGDQFFQQSFLKTRKGEIYFGGYNGFNSFHPDSLKDNAFIPPVYITDFQIFNKPVLYAITDGQFQTHISEAKKIKLNWQQSVFSFSFVGINYSNPSKNQYAYILKGFEKDWNYTNASRRYITYTNLDPGEYMLHVKASNNDGVWNEKGVILQIVILPPWWKSLWFKILGVVILLMAIFGIYYLKLELYRKKQKELSKLVENRTQEITQANKVLTEGQIRIEEQSEELRTHSENLKEANDLLVQKQNLIKAQADKMQETNLELINGNILLENLLQWSRSQTGNVIFEPVSLNLLMVTEGTYNFFEGDAHKKNIAIQLQIDPELTIVADENMLKTILRNLLSNAIKFTPDNGSILVSSSITPQYVEVCISDSGVGIPLEKTSQLFNIETNNSTRGTAQESGTGLGLILCKEFVEKHRGKIWVETKEGLGSKFIFTLPLS